MAKIKKLVAVLLLVSAVLTAALMGYLHVVRDTEPPVISCPEGTMTGSIALTEEELVADVSARDDRDGEVKILVESISPITDGNLRTVTYAAADSSGNVSRCRREISCPDYSRPEFRFSKPVRLPVGTSLYTVLDGIRVTDAAGTDLTARIHFSLLENRMLTEPGIHPLELRVTDSFGYNEVLTVDLEVYNASEETIGVKLTDYLVYLPKGAVFTPMKYFSEATLEGEVSVESDVNPAVPGVYHVEYTVRGSTDRQIGRSRLIVIVTE